VPKQTVFVASRFSGPPNSGNGGYTAGLLSYHIGSPCEVTLRKPIPIEKEMGVLGDFECRRLMAGEELIAEAVYPRDLSIETPEPVSFEAAQAAMEKSPAFQNHPFPTCFVCGPQRSDGLRIFPGSVSGPEEPRMFASAWIPTEEFTDRAGMVRREFIWAALDCPTGFAAGFPYMGKLVTGRLAVGGGRYAPYARANERCVIMSWPLGIEGRKHHAAAALFGEDGSVRAKAKATWIKLD
jgi:hypothetical protein